MDSSSNASTYELDWVTEPTIAQLEAIPFLKVDAAVLDHPIEKRGFVTVPVDYSRPDSPTLEIFYRLIPAIGGKWSDTTTPVVVVVNGGPGMASSGYRPYDFDYTGKVAPKADFLGELTRRFRVLIMDQRGTAGCSAPLDLDNPSIRPEIIARYFDAAHIARDHERMIQQVVGSERFFMIAQSYGGMIGTRYLSMPDIHTLPAGICFSSAAMPHDDALAGMLRRRTSQLALNQSLGRDYPEIVEKIGRARAHCEELGLNPDSVHILWQYLGYGPDKTWQRILSDELDKVVANDLAGLNAWIAEETASNFLNYVLSMSMTPGHTDTTLARLTSREIPFDNGTMLDENWVLTHTGRDGTFREQLIEAMDAHPHPGTPFPSLEEMKRQFARCKVLFSLAEGDAFLPIETVKKNTEKFYVPGITQDIVLSGGHKAIFLPQGVAAFHAWTETIS